MLNIRLGYFEHLFRICVCSSQIFGRKCTAQRFIVKSIPPGSFFLISKKKKFQKFFVSEVFALYGRLSVISRLYFLVLLKKKSKNFFSFFFSSVKGVVTLLLFKHNYEG